MKLSRAILKGCKRFPQKSIGVLYGPDDGKACVLGAAHSTIPKKCLTNQADKDLVKAFPELLIDPSLDPNRWAPLTLLVPSYCKLARSVKAFRLIGLLLKVNDSTDLSREEIATHLAEAGL